MPLPTQPADPTGHLRGSEGHSLRPVAERGFLPNLRPLFDVGELVRRLSPSPSESHLPPARSLAQPLLTAVRLSAVPEPPEPKSPVAEADVDGAAPTGLWGPTFTTCSATLGAGALSLPFAMEHMGLVLGLVMLGVAALATHYSITLLVSVMEVTRLYSYEELTVHTFGRPVGVATEVAIISICFGSAIAYTVAIGDILVPVLRLHSVRAAAAAVAVPAGLLTKRAVLCVLWALVLLPLSLIEKLSILEASSLFGVCSLFYLVVSVCIHAGFSCARDPTATLSRATPVAYSEKTLSTLAILVFAFTCQVNVPSIYQDLRPSDGRAAARFDRARVMRAVSRRACFVCFVCYALIGTAGYLNFPLSRHPNILSNYDISQPRSTYMALAFVAMALTVLAAFPLNIYPCRYTVDVILQRTAVGCCRPAAARPMPPSSPPALGAPMPPRRRVALTLAITGLSLLIALYVPGINIVFQLMGGTASAFVCLILPAALALRNDVPECRSRRGRLGATTLLFTGVLTAVLSTGTTIAGML